MVGGKVIEVAGVKGRPGVLFVDVAERGGGGSKVDTCAIFVEKNETSEKIEIGDSLWWQGRSAMWTPQRGASLVVTGDLRCGIDYDIQIPRVGYSGVKHPDRAST